MRDFREQNYYELLEVKPHVSSQELERSYQRARKFLSVESVATYALFQLDELNLLRRRIEEAYRVLSDPERRRMYDREMIQIQDSGWTEEMEIYGEELVGDRGRADRPVQLLLDTSPPDEPTCRDTEPGSTDPSGAEDPSGVPTQEEQVQPDEENQDTGSDPGQSLTPPSPPPLPSSSVSTQAPSAPAAPPEDELPAIEPPVVDSALEEAEPSTPPVLEAEPAEEEKPEQPSMPELTEETEITGEILRQARLARGLTLHNIADTTKIAIYYLRNLETECFSDLPARVYVRGYLRQIARLLGLDTELVATGYLKRMNVPE